MLFHVMDLMCRSSRAVIIHSWWKFGVLLEFFDRDVLFAFFFNAVDSRLSLQELPCLGHSRHKIRLSIFIVLEWTWIWQSCLFIRLRLLPWIQLWRFMDFYLRNLLLVWMLLIFWGVPQWSCRYSAFWFTYRLIFIHIILYHRARHNLLSCFLLMTICLCFTFLNYRGWSFS